MFPEGIVTETRSGAKGVSDRMSTWLRSATAVIAFRPRSSSNSDRQPWLNAVAAWIDGQRAKGQPGIITCSALKRSYRDMIIGDRPEVRLVYLRGSRALIAGRLAGRQEHFMPASLLLSQFDTLEEPGPDEDPLIVDIGPPAGQLADEIIRLLGASVAIV
jgi:ribose 5-phosphate isomerase A